MPIGSIHKLNFQGEFCSVPIAISMAYKQLADDPVDVNTGVNLIAKWFDEPSVSGGAWRYLRPFLSDELGFACATDSYDNTMVSAFLNGAVGLNTDDATPSPFALQVEIQPQNPHPLAYPGRFYMPGFTNNQLERAGFNDALTQALLQFYVNLLEVEDLGTGQGPRYHLIPHAGYLDRAGTRNDVLAFVPSGNLMTKVIGSRRSDTCQAFLSGGDSGGFEEIIVPPTEPNVTIDSPADGTTTPELTSVPWQVTVGDWDATSCRISTSNVWDVGLARELTDINGQVFSRDLDSSWIGPGVHAVYALAHNDAEQTIVAGPITITVT